MLWNWFLQISFSSIIHCHFWKLQLHCKSSSAAETTPKFHSLYGSLSFLTSASSSSSVSLHLSLLLALLLPLLLLHLFLLLLLPVLILFFLFFFLPSLLFFSSGSSPFSSSAPLYFMAAWLTCLLRSLCWPTPQTSQTKKGRMPKSIAKFEPGASVGP